MACHGSCCSSDKKVRVVRVMRSQPLSELPDSDARQMDATSRPQPKNPVGFSMLFSEASPLCRIRDAHSKNRKKARAHKRFVAYDL